MSQDTPEELDLTEEELVIKNLMADLVRLRKTRRIGQEPLAKAIGLSQARVSQMENLNGAVTLATLLRYARSIGPEIIVSVDPGDGTRPPDKP